MTEQSPDADFSHYRTFALLPVPVPDSAKEPTRALLLARAARAAAVSALISKGYAEAPSNEADFSVALQGQSLPRSPAPPSASPTSVQTARGSVTVFDGASSEGIAYDERTLRVEVFDNRTRVMVWSGWTRKLTAAPSQPEGVQEAVHRILAKFPPNAVTAVKQP